MDARSDWQWLPEGLLDLIIKKLVRVSDCLRFSVVCKHWHSVATGGNLKKLCIQRSTEEPPKLMIPAKIGSTKKRGIYLVCQGKIHNLKLRVPYNRRCCGSSYGWLAFAMKNHSILYNPFTRRKLDLPRLNVVAPCKHQYWVHKIVLSANPSLESDNFEAVATYGNRNRMAYIKFGQQKWIDILPELDASDVIFHQNMIYAVDYNNRIVSTDITTRKQKMVTQEMNRTCDTAYLVESSRTELYTVRRFLKRDPVKNIFKTSKFEVYKLVKSDQDDFVQKLVNDLEGDTFFLGDNQSVSIVASKFAGCRANCIYYTDDYHEFFYSDGPNDIGVYNLEDKSFGMHYVPDTLLHKNRPPPIWITPTPRIAPTPNYD